jgi:AcrR family transcriptional regulator
MSPRQAAVLRDSGSEGTLRDHLIAAAARLIERRRSATVTVREIAQEAKVADGVLYNHFANKEELIVQAVHAHVLILIERTIGRLPEAAGQGSVEENLRSYLNRGLELLTAVLPIFGGLLSQPRTLARFGEMSATTAHGMPLRAALRDYLQAEQELGRVAATVNADAAATMIIGACHDLVLPHLLHGPPPVTVDIPAGFVDDLIATLWCGIAPATSKPADMDLSVRCPPAS